MKFDSPNVHGFVKARRNLSCVHVIAEYRTQGDAHMTTFRTQSVRCISRTSWRRHLLGLCIFGSITLLLVIGALSLPGCRTTEGFGQDVEHLGNNIADSADKHKP
jgi:predicted small secreted protein